jgi:hypothetical protein
LDAATQPRLCEAVATLRSHGPDATELASLASRLALAGIDVTLPAPAPPRAPPRWKKWAAGGGAASGALVLLVLSMKPPAPLVAVANPASGALELETRGQALRDAASPSSRAARRPNLPSTRVELAQPTTAETREEERAPATAPEAIADASEQAPLRVPPAAGSTPLPAPSNGATRDTRNPTRDTSSAQAGTPELRAAPSEIELLRDARLALKQAPARALTLVEAHAHAYPAGKLTQERELIGISALVALGRRTAALSRGARFQRDFPTSPYRDQVQQLLR